LVEINLRINSSLGDFFFSVILFAAINHLLGRAETSFVNTLDLLRGDWLEGLGCGGSSGVSGVSMDVSVVLIVMSHA
jgi:hypothetical protein